MTPNNYLNQFSPFPPIVGDQQDQIHLLPFTPTDASPLIPCSILFDTPQDQEAYQQQKLNDHSPIGGSSDRPLLFPRDNNNNNNNFVEESSLCDRYAREEDPHKWMSSKMRLMRKMMMTKPKRNMQSLEDQQQLPIQEGSNSNKSNSHSDIIRICSDCNTTKTPLWRSGPRGPKSLCNACGIRQRKARRAMATAALSGGLVPADTPCKELKEKKSFGERTVPFKKRCKFTSAGTTQKKLRFDNFTISISKNSAFHRVFPQDETDAAILLMALSCGIICS